MQENNQESKFKSVKKLSQKYDIPIPTIRSWIKNKSIPYKKFGRLVRINEDLFLNEFGEDVQTIKSKTEEILNN